MMVVLNCQVYFLSSLIEFSSVINSVTWGWGFVYFINSFRLFEIVDRFAREACQIKGLASGLKQRINF